MDKFIYKRKQNYFWERSLVEIAKHPVMFLAKTRITPNMITLCNLLIIFPLCCYSAWIKSYYLSAFLIQLYCLLDVMDGNLARNKNLSSALGKKLDELCDSLFYIVFFLILGIRMNAVLYTVIFSAAIQFIYGLIATHYIAPQIRNNEHFKRTKLKQFFYDRGVLFGMDATLHSLIVTIMLLTPVRVYVFWVTSCLWVVDLLYRLYEVKKQK